MKNAAQFLLNPRTPEQLVAAMPSYRNWKAELQSGWPGPDGSTSSLDNIEGIQIGLTTTDYRTDLPANLHDFRYRVIRRLWAGGVIDKSMVQKMRAAADAEHLEKLLEAVSVLVGWHGFKARIRARVRYRALRLFAFGAVRPREE